MYFWGLRGGETRRTPYSYPERAIGPDRNRAARSDCERLLPEHSEAADRISNRATHEDIRQEMNIEREP